jgi:ferredoxin--NADP+ reductase
MSDLRFDQRPIAQLNATVQEIRRVGDGLVLRCKPDPGLIRSYRPGQYTSIGLLRVGPNGKETFLKRAYSLGSLIVTEDGTRLVNNSEMDFYEFYISRVPYEPGDREQLTPRIFELKAGDRLFISTKIVGFHTLEGVEPTANILFLASGTGEAPHNSMIRQVLSENRPIKLASLILESSGWKSAYRPMHEATMTLFPQYKAVFQTYESQDGFLELIARLLREPALSRDMIGFSLEPESSHVFLCGDPAMIGAPKKRGGWEIEEQESSLIRLLNDNRFVTETKFQEGNITFETYW